MELMDLILKRRSVRRYTTEDIPEETRREKRRRKTCGRSWPCRKDSGSPASWPWVSPPKQRRPTPLPTRIGERSTPSGLPPAAPVDGGRNPAVPHAVRPGPEPEARAPFSEPSAADASALSEAAALFLLRRGAPLIYAGRNSKLYPRARKPRKGGNRGAWNGNSSP